MQDAARIFSRYRGFRSPEYRWIMPRKCMEHYTSGDLRHHTCEAVEEVDRDITCSARVRMLAVQGGTNDNELRREPPIGFTTEDESLIRAFAAFAIHGVNCHSNMTRAAYSTSCSRSLTSGSQILGRSSEEERIVLDGKSIGRTPGRLKSGRPDRSPQLPD